MRGPLDPEQLLSPELLKSANTLLSVCLAVIAALGLLAALGSLLIWHPITALIQAAGAITLPLSIWMIVRLLSELLVAQTEINERLILLNENVIASDFEVTPEPSAEATETTPVVPVADIVEEEDTTPETTTPPVKADDISVEDSVDTALANREVDDQNKDDTKDKREE